MCQMVVTGERHVFYFGIFICGATLSLGHKLAHIILLQYAGAPSIPNL